GSSDTSATGGRRAIHRSTQISPLAVTSRLPLDKANGSRGSRSRSATVKYGARIDAKARPANESADNLGAAGAAACFISSTQAGARNAEELAAQSNVRVKNMARIPPSAGSWGKRRNARHEKAVTAPMAGPSLPPRRPTRSTANPVATSTVANTTWSIMRIQIRSER